MEVGEWSTVKIAMMEDSLSPSVMTSGQVEMEFRDILSKLLDSRFDQFEILNLARKFSIQLPQDINLSKQTLVIQKFVLEQLLKSDQSEYYICNCEKGIILSVVLLAVCSQLSSTKST